MPVALNLESIVLFAVPHMLIEVADTEESIDELFSPESQHTPQVCHFSSLIKPILSL